jgi:putative ATP-binding cassette transporter
MTFRRALLDVEKPDGARSTIDVTADSDKLIFDHVAVTAGSREVSLENGIAEIKSGERVLIIGKPGTGKSMFFRAIAGLWPWGKGHVSVPPRAKTIFLPQRSYVGPGSLREVLAYPQPASSFTDADLTQALERTELRHLIPSLDRETRWDKELTADEQQHLSFARLLVHRPQWVISDEAICHLNEDDREIMFSLFERELAKTAVVSITSNDVQHKFYPRVLRLISRSVAEGWPAVVPSR